LNATLIEARQRVEHLRESLNSTMRQLSLTASNLRNESINIANQMLSNAKNLTLSEIESIRREIYLFFIFLFLVVCLFVLLCKIILYLI
jgi:hypothetical protein